MQWRSAATFAAAIAKPLADNFFFFAKPTPLFAKQ
jgi:hypothetical protein